MPCRARTRIAGTPSCTVERLAVVGGVVDPDEHDVDAALREGRQQREQVALGAADPPHAVDVRDPHAGRRPSPASPAIRTNSAGRLA